MNFTEMDYMKGTTALLKEVLKLKKYKAMSLVWAILTAVLMSPWIIASVLFAAISYVLGFVSKSMIAPIDYLHVLLNKEGGEVKHAT
ncbi:MAG: hypothetical protein IKD07_02375, partial [Clostridia bacterium]|nr:hypothetical protein [Clostridia bacterium]